MMEGLIEKGRRKAELIILYIFECARRSIRNISGDDNLEEIPVPIPNTEVKL